MVACHHLSRRSREAEDVSEQEKGEGEGEKKTVG
jgi:hypothetical protein